jgi:predicted dinucleotide-binding enzyme
MSARPSGRIDSIAVLGAGRVGTVIAQRAVEAGYKVRIAASGSPDAIALIVEVLAPGALAVTAAEAVEASDLVILAVPLARHRSLPFEQLTGRIVVDAMNYWPPIDGVLEEFERSKPSTSEHVATLMPEGAELVKTLNHIGYHDMDERARPAGAADRVALAIAGDNRGAVADVAHVVDDLGFDPVDAGPLAMAAAFSPGAELFGAAVARSEVVAMLERWRVSAGDD